MPLYALCGQLQILQPSVRFRAMYQGSVCSDPGSASSGVMCLACWSSTLAGRQ